jgi:hypothetical protein
MSYIKYAKELILQQKLTTEDVKEMWIDAFDAAGVDNWVGYDEAVGIYKQWIDEAKKEANVQTDA